jgi:hypothetical protein
VGEKRLFTDRLYCIKLNHGPKKRGVGFRGQNLSYPFLLHLNLWSGVPAFLPSRGPPAAIPRHWEADDPQSWDPFPDYDNVFTD